MYWFKDKATLSFLFEKAMIYMYITYIKCGKTIEVGGSWIGTLEALCWHCSQIENYLDYQ